MTHYMMTARRILKGEFDANPGPVKYLKMQEGQTTPDTSHVLKSGKQWFQEIRDKADDLAAATATPFSTSPKGDVLFYVHGFNTTQRVAFKRQVDLENNLRAEGWRGVVVGFDWPSDSHLLNYAEDRMDGAKVAESLVTKGILPLAIGDVGKCETNVHILAHSAGAYVVVSAFLKSLDRGKIFKSDWRIGQVALISADISASSLAQGHERTDPMFRRIMRLTNYQNPFDSVLAVSNAKRLGVSPRVGRVGLPDNAHPKSANVNCGPFFDAMDPGSALTIDIEGNIPHAWYTANRVFARDLAMTLEGAIDRHAIPTREMVNGELNLKDAKRPKYQDAWKLNPSEIY
jgi:pimeloyl-ACP methyl ester carboxylesterase